VKKSAATEGSGVARVASRRPVGSPVVEAAFFDLDKTVIAKASMVAFSGPLHRAGMLTRRTLLRAAWGQLVYAQFGASPAKLAKLRDSVLRLTVGWDQAEIVEIVRETLVDVVEPIVFDEALELIREHQAAGHKVFLVSASPEEIVAPLAQYLGVDEAIATRAELDANGRYTGRTERYCYGPEKVAAVVEVAERDGIDLAASYAYSDSGTDVPMLEAVGHAVAVNPDRELLRAARQHDWEVRRFTNRVPLRERVSMPAPKHAALGGGAVLAAVGAGVAARWLWDRRRPPPPSRRRWGLSTNAGADPLVRSSGASSWRWWQGQRSRRAAAASSWPRW
jgi:HAD superfamily hydrolase (TIGR01490 family)